MPRTWDFVAAQIPRRWCEPDRPWDNAGHPWHKSPPPSREFLLELHHFIRATREGYRWSWKYRKAEVMGWFTTLLSARPWGKAYRSRRDTAITAAKASEYAAQQNAINARTVSEMARALAEYKAAPKSLADVPLTLADDAMGDQLVH